MIPFIKRFSYLHLKNLDDLQPDETEVKGIVPSPRYNLRARAEEEFLGVPLTPPKRVTHFPRLEEGNVPINTSCCHRCRLSGELRIARMEWPVYSSELNPIENLWDAFGRAVC
ncbi:hypothetical protein TNCV_791771 [Trichonephila clavipes]|nr:hypothetical protein TNCV_791771 [Trichonephila clavipes]